jgi:hypothetical protein
MPDRQAIVQAKSDATITLGSGNLQIKATNKGIPTVLVNLPLAGEDGYHKKMDELSDALSPLTGNSRLYIRGHGSWKNQTVGKVDAKTWARTLLNAGLPKVAIISICACQAGRDLGSSDATRVVLSADSFASQFHKHLKDMANYELIVYARVYKVIVGAGNLAPVGVKKTGDKNAGVAPTHDRQHSKLRFSWEGGKQQRDWVDYEHGGTSSVEEDVSMGGLNVIDMFG